MEGRGIEMENLKKENPKLYAQVVKLTEKYSGSKVLHQSSKSYKDSAGSLILESCKIYKDHQRIDRAVLSASDLAQLDKSTAEGDIEGFRTKLGIIATYQLFCTGYAARVGLASHAREHSHCYRRVARALGRKDLYAKMLFGKHQKKLAPVTLSKIVRPEKSSKSKTAKLVRAGRKSTVKL